MTFPKSKWLSKNKHEPDKQGFESKLCYEGISLSLTQLGCAKLKVT